MSQTRILIDTMKRPPRRLRITSQALELSQASVKRLFVEESFKVTCPGKSCELLHPTSATWRS